MIALVATAAGTFAVDLETRGGRAGGAVRAAAAAEPEPAARRRRRRRPARRSSRSSTRGRRCSSRTTPGSTWRESGRGLPPGRAVAVAATDPDTLAYAARNRLYVSRDGGVFWTALAVELPEIDAVALREA